ncbi:MAG: hypothetical protein JJ896_11285 [Rhodothermales bacterium]|nr:hypothetical protein [Rhodothermales bacterium]MBO6780225.1 hypothetical protein [Rhodothermales bacterium]
MEHVAEAFAEDSELLTGNGFTLKIVITQPGFIRSIVSRADKATQIDWARDSAWRFMPVSKSELGGYVLHDIDVATNKVLALAGREEARDFVDILYVMENILALGPLIWAAVAKDPGYSPHSLLEQLRRRGRYRPEDFERLDLVKPFDLSSAKGRWSDALDTALDFLDSRPMDEAGCLYYRESDGRFVSPTSGPLAAQGVVTHFGRVGGILPRPASP